ncbi:PEPxxWA-CTERM sorting domain-containing protein [Sandaracinobacter sp. RS1-74]|uniref:PEPxxWA-CTERM sorting domain-containing protein n=1 Tax=Sandaracinobacteroides sayramensis TaxID=2913411 RepID=UPI001EDA62E5|nr:PEPxxWA-CTERM sorting domain-containing protein [Sandaracinobacteroides sayramensis]MCG2842668.1 PEPxxWA-CTERM sorting domain-containing protein [Sandaracinobacteroides sayramensis]
MTNYMRATAMLLGAATMLSAATAANASYFIRPVLQYGQGEMVDGLSLNNQTSGSQTFNDGATRLESHVSMADGTIKTYVSSDIPQSNFLIATAIYGDTIRYTGSSDEAVGFFVNFDGWINSQQYEMGEYPNNSRFIGVDAYFAVYEAGTGATWSDWTVVGSQKGNALYNSREFISWQDNGLDFSESFSFEMGDYLNLETNKYYEVYVAFNLLLQPGIYGGSVEIDSLNTATLSIFAGEGEIGSVSGDLLGFEKAPPPIVPGGVPEPATWAMFILGFGAVGAAVRRRRSVAA